MGGRGRGRARATECANESEIVGGGGTARDSGPAPAQNSSQTIYIFWGSFVDFSGLVVIESVTVLLQVKHDIDFVIRSLSHRNDGAGLLHDDPTAVQN